MNVATITMERKKAQELFQQYRQSVRIRATSEDVALMRGYKALAKGHAVLNLQESMQRVGVDHLHRPRLAIARADAPIVYFTSFRNGGGGFKIYSGWWEDQKTRCQIRLPEETFPWRGNENPFGESWKAPTALVPPIPPALRPAHALSNYHLLWEPEWKQVAPRDPILLRRLHGMLFAVIAQWDLTELERAVLAGRLVAH